MQDNKPNTAMLVIGTVIFVSVIGAWLFGHVRYHALLVPAALTGATGLGYAAYRQWRGVAPERST